MKKIFSFIILIALAIVLYKPIKNALIKTPEKEKFVYEDILNNTNENNIDIERLTIYGKHLNLTFDTTKDCVLILKNNEKELSYKLETNNNKLILSKYINNGLNLEKLEVGEYLVLLKDNVTNIYYNVLNKTDYHDNQYYTITKNGKNNLIKFKENNFNNKKYFTINVKEEKLPENIYDIVIDPGHGGVDTGAGNGKYHESKFTLDYAKSLKEELEKIGLKVKMTRETDTSIESYGESSRTGIPYEVKAKLMLDIHLNSSGSSKQRGVEIYKASHDDNTFAKILADSIHEETEIPYSNNPMNKVDDGIYMRVYSSRDIENTKKDAKKYNYEPYNLDDDVTYYYFIRETGGIMTKAFSDGRNPKKKANPYRNMNQGVEAYLCELAYISQNDDLEMVINHKDKFVKALVKAVTKYVNE